jgi:hypothetical protein
VLRNLKTLAESEVRYAGLTFKGTAATGPIPASPRLRKSRTMPNGRGCCSTIWKCGCRLIQSTGLSFRPVGQPL